MSQLLAVLVGGVLGTGIRLATETLTPHVGGDFPLSTLIINVLGSFLLGLIIARFWSAAPPWMKAGLGTGLLGSFTTFSALMVSVVALTGTGLWLLAVIYLVLSLVLGFGAAVIGLRVGRVSTPIDWVDE